DYTPLHHFTDDQQPPRWPSLIALVTRSGYFGSKACCHLTPQEVSLRPQIPESTNLLTVERQVQPDAKTRPSLFLYRVLPVAVCVLAIAGLGVFAFINLGGEDFHFYWDAVIVALLCGVLGGSAVWLVHGALHTTEPTTTVQLVHEVGMGFIVSCVTI